MTSPLVDKEYLKEIDKARRDLRALIYSRSCAPIMLRLAWHDAGTYDAKTKTGGPNGSIRNEEEYSHGSNNGLKKAIDFCEEVKSKHPRITYADLYQLAGVVAVEVTGGPVIDFSSGRKDSKISPKEGRLPDAKRGAPHLREKFYRMGLSDKDIVALSGGHTLGRAHPDRSGFDGPWTKEPLQFDNSYFVELLNEESEGLLKLPTDAALVEDPEFRKYVDLYAKDAEAFFRDYAESHKKLSELGFTPNPTSSKTTAKDSTILAQGAVGVAVAAVVVSLGYLYEAHKRANTIFGLCGFGLGISIGLVAGYFLFIYVQSSDVQNPEIRPLVDQDTETLQRMLPEIPQWVKNPDYDRAICKTAKEIAKPIIAKEIPNYKIESVEFETLTLGSLPPTFQGMKVYVTDEKELIMEPSIKWAGNPNVLVAAKAFGMKATVQVLDLQVFVAPRITLKPLVPSFPCFAQINVSLMDKPYVDFGLKLLGADLMSIPGLYRFVQELIKDQVANMYLWPKTLEVPIMDPAKAFNRPVGMLHVKVLRAMKLKKKDLLGASDPYVKLKLTENNMPSKKTTVKHKNLNPEWNEEFNLVVKDPESQALELLVYDWEKVGKHDKMGMNVVPMKDLPHNEPKVMTLDLLKNMDLNDATNEKQRGQLEVELHYKPFKEEDMQKGFDETLTVQKAPEGTPPGGGLLVVVVHEGQDLEGKHHCNPSVRLIFRGEEKRTKVLKKSRDPRWAEDFQFMCEEPPTNDKLHVEVVSTSSRMGLLHGKESLGYVQITLTDVVSNKRINQKYHLIDSKNGQVQIELQWRTVE
ncbi:hypothetical protein DVH24_009974 [Malus domestica]|uniref:L-ascorbate peroxidase n=1 Tax=Malus domestica TaxID=3750 RepID=A0A498JNZ6_MALDO|nr:hypothetical protein DVH24_009974 [Malus domestica]